MADHMIKEQQGLGGKYRRGSLEKFTNYVNDENDFPFNQFISRNSPAEAAIGYDKVLMFNEMLRFEVGDKAFLEAYSKFYTDNKFSYASFDDIRIAFEAVSGKDLEAFFTQWSTRTGAPTLKLSKVEVSKDAHYELSFEISQTQTEDVFFLSIPVAIYLEGSDEVILKTIPMTKRQETIKMMFDKRPLRIDIDPQTNVFRRLDPQESPPTLSQLFGSVDGHIVLPAKSELAEAYGKLASDWKAIQEEQNKKFTILMDADIDQLPAGACWIVGKENKFAKDYMRELYGTFLTEDVLAQAKTIGAEGSLVYTFLNSENDNQITGFLSSTNPEAIAALTRKLPHYGKYSYLGFEGESATNKLKGEFPALNSPLSFLIEYEDKPIITAKLKEREALHK